MADEHRHSRNLSNVPDTPQDELQESSQLDEVVDLQEFAKLLRTFPDTILRCLKELYEQHSM